MPLTQSCIDDQELITIYLSGNEKALETLVERHKSRLFNYILMLVNDRELADDVFQETFFKIISTLKRGTYNDEGKFLPWAMRIAHNLVIDHFRREKRMPMVSPVSNEDGEEMDIFETLGIADESREDKLIKKQMQKSLRELVERLPAEQREVLMMRHYYDMSFKEISETTNVSINTALGRMRYALINLRKMMKENEVVLVIND